MKSQHVKSILTKDGSRHVEVKEKCKPVSLPRFVPLSEEQKLGEVEVTTMNSTRREFIPAYPITGSTHDPGLYTESTGAH